MAVCLLSDTSVVYSCLLLRHSAHMTLKSRGISAVDADRIGKLNETYLEVEV